MLRVKLLFLLPVVGALAILPALALAAQSQSAPVQAATPTEAMMQQATPTAGVMVQEGTPTAGAMMQQATPAAPTTMPTTGGDSTNALIPAIVLGVLAIGGGLAFRRFTHLA